MDLVGVDDSGDVGVGHLMDGKGPSFLLLAGLGVGSEDVVEFLEGTLGPYDESSNVTSGGQLEKVESADVSDLNSGNVSQSLDEGNISSTVDNQRSSSGSVSSVSELSFSGSDLDGVNDLLDIRPSSDILEESNGLLSSFDFFGGIGDDQGEFGDVVDSVSSGLNQGKDNGGSQGSGDGVSLLLDVASSVPSSPDSDGSEHSSLSTHVSEGTLTISGCSGPGNSGNSGHSSTCSPGLSGVLHTGVVLDGMTLSSVLADVGVDEVDDIGPDSDAEDGGEDSLASGLFDDIFAGVFVGVVNVDDLSVDHGE